MFGNRDEYFKLSELVVLCRSYKAVSNIVENVIPLLPCHLVSISVPFCMLWFWSIPRFSWITVYLCVDPQNMDANVILLLDVFCIGACRAIIHPSTLTLAVLLVSLENDELCEQR